MVTVLGVDSDANLPPPSLTVAVAVLTYVRNDQLRLGLPLLLEEVRSLERHAPELYQADIIVVDNDPQGGAALVIKALGSDRVRYVVERRPGIAAARNRALSDAGTDLLVFIDDDEAPTEGWLVHLLATWRRHRAAAVAGRVVSEFAGPLDPWISAGAFFVRRSLVTGTTIKVAATNNLLIDLRQIRGLGITFTEEFGLLGGEDTLFTRSVVQLGGLMVWCNEAVVTDIVPLSRMSRRWVLMRAFGHGNTLILVDATLALSGRARTLVRYRAIVRGGVRVIAGLLGCGVGFIARSDRQQARGLRLACRGGGMLAGGMGIAYGGYARDGHSWRIHRPERSRVVV